jgi:hypothetical protein
MTFETSSTRAKVNGFGRSERWNYIAQDAIGLRSRPCSSTDVPPSSLGDSLGWRCCVPRTLFGSDHHWKGHRQRAHRRAREVYACSSWEIVSMSSPGADSLPSRPLFVKPLATRPWCSVADRRRFAPSMCVFLSP